MSDTDTGKEKDPEIAAFHAWLGPQRVQVHRLAAEHLKTRYDPRRTNAWNAWLKVRG